MTLDPVFSNLNLSFEFPNFIISTYSLKLNRHCKEVYFHFLHNNEIKKFNRRQVYFLRTETVTVFLRPPDLPVLLIQFAYFIWCLHSCGMIQRVILDGETVARRPGGNSNFSRKVNEGHFHWDPPSDTVIIGLTRGQLKFRTHSMRLSETHI